MQARERERKKKERKKEINYGICILRAIFAFQVVMRHNGVHTFFWIGDAVPFFMLASFYFNYKIFCSQNQADIKRRIFRIGEPYIVYGIISFVLLSFIDILLTKNNISYIDLLWQLLFGSNTKLDPPLWFLFDLIICSAIVWIVFRYFSNPFFLLFSMLVLSLILQYTNINFLLFSHFPYVSRPSLGRLSEMLPYACLGIIIAKLQILEKNYGNIQFIFSIMIAILFFNNHMFPHPKNGFVYQGIHKIIISVLIFSLFYSIKFKNINILVKIILFISKYSLGIFCIHNIIINIFNSFDCTIFAKNSFIKSFLIYLISLYIAIIIGKIHSKWARNLVN